jgi:hypothetical protein
MYGDYSIQKGSVLHLVLRLRGGGGSVPIDAIDTLSGFGVGGRISQKINRDPLPVTAYDHSKVQQFHITVINAAYFSAITGLTSLPSPITTSTYLQHGLPWFELYDEHIPTANNTSSATPLAGVRSIAQTDADRKAAGGSNTQAGCEYCAYEMATQRLSPCGHVFCDDCSTTTACPTCEKRFTSRERFAAPMPLPGKEDDYGVEALSLDERIVKLRAGESSGTVISSQEQFAAPMPLPGKEDDDGVEALSLDERIVKLRDGDSSGRVISFRLRNHAISPLCGALQG